MPSLWPGLLPDTHVAYPVRTASAADLVTVRTVLDNWEHMLGETWRKRTGQPLPPREKGENLGEKKEKKNANRLAASS